MFTLRRYQPSDMEAVEYLHVYAIQQSGAYLGRGPWDDDVYAIEEAYLNKQGEFLIGEWDGSFVAMGALRRTSPERAEIKRMRVHPDYQGRGWATYPHRTHRPCSRFGLQNPASGHLRPTSASTETLREKRIL